MEENKILKVKSWIYDCTNAEVQAMVKQTEDAEILYSYMYICATSGRNIKPIYKIMQI